MSMHRSVLLLGWSVVLAVPLLAAGCNSSGLSAAEYDRAQRSLEQALEAWKRGEAAKKWAAETAPVRCVDLEWNQGYRLLDFQIVGLTADSNGYPEARVRLSVQKAKGPAEERDALYGINLKKGNQVVISRDPMFGL